ncbi:hypothetical protein GII36_04815 [Candidatus Mycosynbacter amalyticus]|uniref:DUF3558 domain-containing protein n=1 Tax=Candidatus Mycosynbacter amalyticus TaxID=2665156 RepID=A0A857MNH9_9BACT|nr:hypothetical protein [Candidatus Mycosynbacter amalyticus]QHN43142.1 hypothetical protein GII36_04815 [Candidatus Mycosynbacter amalyticus]
MNHRLRSVKLYVAQHTQCLLTMLFAIVLLAAGMGLVVWFAHTTAPKVVYDPTNACKLFTTEEATDLLGSATIQSVDDAPVVSRNTAVSKCGYTDGNHDQNQMVVAAIIVRSGINDDGVLENKRDFVKSQPRGATEVVQGVGDAAFFNTSNGQLSVLDGRDWLILSYGVGADPSSNTKDQALKLADIVVPSGAGTVPAF